MRRLNNKGFAVSTILYGILALTIIILMLIFGIMKANKDMNQDLASNVESNINKCTLSEVELENCYFFSEACDTKTYYSCIGKKEEGTSLYNSVEIGDFVNYDAGVWPLTLPMPNNSDLFSFGGYEAGISRNVSSKNSGYDGWRVIYKKDNNVYLVHAGIPEYFYFEIDKNEKNIYNYEYIIKGSYSKPYNESYNHTAKDWNGEYLNSDFADSVRNINTSDLEIWKQQANASYYNTDLIYISDTYLLSEIDDNVHKVTIFNINTGDIDLDDRGVYGIRPIVKLKHGIKTSGFVTNTYGMKEWILSN